MTSSMNKKIVLSLYRTTLKFARVYGKLAEGKQSAAMEEIASFNHELKIQKIRAKNSLNRGVMTPNLAYFAARHLYRRGMSAPSEDHELLLSDAIAAYKKINQKVTMFTQFPDHTQSVDLVNGVKIEAKSHFINVTPESGRFRYQILLRFTNTSQTTLQLLSERLSTKDETLTEMNRDNGFIALQKKIPPPLQNSGIYEHATTVSLPTPLGYCKCDYVFANTHTGEIVLVPVPPLLLSTHDPDTALRQSCYRGDARVDLEAVGTGFRPAPVSSGKKEVIDRISPPADDRGEGKESMNADDDEKNLVRKKKLATERIGLVKGQSINRSLDFQPLDHDDVTKQDEEADDDNDDGDHEDDEDQGSNALHPHSNQKAAPQLG